MTGISPITIPMLTAKSRKKVTVIPPVRSAPKRSRFEIAEAMQNTRIRL